MTSIAITRPSRQQRVFNPVDRCSNCTHAKADQPALDAEEQTGRDLFVYEWEAFDLRSPQGDGLEPQYNACSCVACHDKGGLGGAAENDKNIAIVTNLDATSPDFARGMQSIQQGDLHHLQDVTSQLIRFYASPFKPRSKVLHRYGISPDYDQWRAGWFHKLRTRPPSGSGLPRKAFLRFGERNGEDFYAQARLLPCFGRSNC